MSLFYLVTWHWWLCGVFWESILIGTGFKTFDGRSIRIKGYVPPICTFQCEVPVKTYFLWIFSKNLYMRPNSSGLVIPSLKPLVVIVAVLRIFLVLYLYHLYINKCRQEWLLSVGLHLKLQYPSTFGGHRVMGKLLWSSGNFSRFLLL